jgi:hypothetical protein
MNSVRTYHNEAIRAAQLAMAALHQGNQEEHQKLVYQAMVSETNAANRVPDEKTSETTRSLIYRSAASFAYQAGEYEEAERLIFKGLSGYPPAEIRQQLLEVQQMIQQVWGERQASGKVNSRLKRQIVTAIYENGVLHPTTTLALPESQMVAIQILPVPEGVVL